MYEIETFSIENFSFILKHGFAHVLLLYEFDKGEFQIKIFKL